LKNPNDKLNNYVKLDEDGKKLTELQAAKDLYKMDPESKEADPEVKEKPDPEISADHKDLVEVLKDQIAEQKKELDIKNKQIADLNDRLADITKTLDQQQQLAALDKQKLLALEAKESVVEEQKTETKKGFFSKLFNK